MLGNPQNGTLISGNPYLEGHGDVARRLFMGIYEGVLWLLGAVNLLATSP